MRSLFTSVLVVSMEKTVNDNCTTPLKIQPAMHRTSAHRNFKYVIDNPLKPKYTSFFSGTMDLIMYIDDCNGRGKKATFSTMPISIPDF